MTTAKSAPESASTPAERGLGRAGPVELALPGLRRAITEARVLQVWRGQPAPLDALDAPLVRRRLLTQALETRVVRLEVTRRGLNAPKAELDRALANAAEGRGPEAPRVGPLPAPEVVAKALRARYGVEPGVVERVAQDLLDAKRLAQALLDEVTDEALRQRWVDANTTVTLDLVEVPRVPTTAEIDAAVRARGPEIEAWYAKNRARFNSPARARVHRMFVKGTTPEARQRLEGLRDRVAAGETFETVAAAHSEGPQARQGGRVGALTLSKLPAEPLAPGHLTQPRAEPGGFAFYQIDDLYPAVERPLSRGTVRREIAAALLREQDALPEAQRAAQAMREQLAAGREGVPPKLARQRITRRVTAPFPLAGRKVVPGLGLAPALFEAAFAAQPGAVVGPFTVRQSYVLGRITARETPATDAWPAAKADFERQWRQAAGRTVLDRWLSTRLEGETMWIAMDRLAALPRAALLEAGVQTPTGDGPVSPP